jgi:hypothetical protein
MIHHFASGLVGSAASAVVPAGIESRTQLKHHEAAAVHGVHLPTGLAKSTASPLLVLIFYLLQNGLVMSEFI